jgi:hypothetical protein
VARASSLAPCGAFSRFLHRRLGEPPFPTAPRAVRPQNESAHFPASAWCARRAPSLSVACAGHGGAAPKHHGHVLCCLLALCCAQQPFWQRTSRQSLVEPLPAARGPKQVQGLAQPLPAVNWPKAGPCGLCFFSVFLQTSKFCTDLN